MKKQITTNKERFGLYNLALERIQECEKYKKEIIPFPEIFEKLCRSFSIKKKEDWELLFMLRDFELIEIIKFHGVRIR